MNHYLKLDLLKEPEDIDRLENVYRLKKQFWWFSVIASLNHALNYVVTAYATSLLGIDHV